MDLTELRKLIDNKAILSLVCAAGGALLGNLVAVYRARIRILEYTVNHERVALAAEDQLFGTVAVSWQGAPVTNLYVSTVEIQNRTTTDLSALEFKVWTGSTLLLTERTEMPGTTFVPTYTAGFSQAIQVPADQAPTDAQFNVFRHNREYRIPVLNRGQRALFRYLTTVPGGAEGPSVWLDMLHPGVQVVFRPNAPEILGVAVKLALPLGLLVCLVAVAAVSVFIRQVWLAAVLCVLAGLAVQTIGAFVYKAFRFIKQVVFR